MKIFGSSQGTFVFFFKNDVFECEVVWVVGEGKWGSYCSSFSVMCVALFLN